MAGPAGVGFGAPADCKSGKSWPALRQSAQPSRHTSESLLTRPSESHFRMISPLAGPYWPPVGGRTYQIAAGASAIGSAAPTGGAAIAAAGAEAEESTA